MTIPWSVVSDIRRPFMLVIVGGRVNEPPEVRRIRPIDALREVLVIYFRDRDIETVIGI